MLNGDAVKAFLLKRFADVSDVGHKECLSEVLSFLEQCPEVTPSDLWVPVRVPPKIKGKYLVWEHLPYGGVMRECCYSPCYGCTEGDSAVSAVWSKDLLGRAVWFNSSSDYGDFEVTGITHWMPLPKDPKDGVS